MSTSENGFAKKKSLIFINIHIVCLQLPPKDVCFCFSVMRARMLVECGEDDCNDYDNVAMMMMMQFQSVAMLNPATDRLQDKKKK